MKKQTRNTEFWTSDTPNKVGPGSYELSPPRKYRYNSAPFSKTATKPNGSKITPSALPGPGSYSPSLEWRQSVSPLSSFISNLPRTGAIPTGNLNLVPSPLLETPGPGHYYSDSLKTHKPSRKIRHLSMIVEASIASIPYKPGTDQQLGPTSYDPNIGFTKPKVVTTNFSVSSSKRDMFDYKGNLIVGPGKYSPDVDHGDKKQSWTFASKVSKNLEAKVEQAPGPGSYNPKTYSRQPRVMVEGFGSTTERDISLTNDPHRPYGPIEHLQSVPEVNLNSEKMDYFRQKYLNPKNPVVKPAFGTSDKRESKWLPNDLIVGPGDYQVKPVTSHSPKLPNKSPRFKDSKNNSLPGPGAYEMRIPAKNQIYLNQSTRFKPDKHENPENYIPHQPWKIKQNRAFENEFSEPGPVFESTTPRFMLNNFDSPGPGQYVIKEKKKIPSIVNSTKARFAGHGSYIQQAVTDIDIGPGSYYKDAKMGKKTFNISPDIGDDRPWI